MEMKKTQVGNVVCEQLKGDLALETAAVAVLRPGIEACRAAGCLRRRAATP